MSDASEERDLLAAEYVLGLLDAATVAQVAAQAETDPALQAAIAAWQETLAPLSLLADPVPPPAALWRRLAVSTGAPPTAPRTSALVRLWRNITLWRCAAGSGFALAAALVAFVLLREPPNRPVAALVPAGGAPAAFVAEMEPNGTLRLVALQPISVAPGKDLELWALPAGATQPVPLGLLPAAGRHIAPPSAARDGMQLMVSLEPHGGSPTGLPTGPVLFAGTVHADD